MRGRGWIVGGVLAIALIVVVLISQQSQQSSDHSSNSDAVDGASAMRLFAASMGHPTDQISGGFSVPGPGGLMFVFTPTSPYTADEANSVASWVRSGGVLVYASEGGDPELDRALGSQRIQALVTETSLDAGGPVADGVSKLAGGDYAMPFQLGPQQVAIVRVGQYPVAYLQRLGSGTVIAMSDPLPLTNGYLDRADNGRFAADLLGLVSSSAPVQFDEYHHGITVTDLSPQAWLLTPWGAALMWLLLAVFFGLLLRGRRFG
ncbi:MAG TPA: DUF4350 domain-containing protein, partial [Candidatus Limnocylindrales bacterium]|nr:DUF4350 domain-containing protein [Candidatus Limnocylindrales bacterium]